MGVQYELNHLELMFFARQKLYLAVVSAMEKNAVKIMKRGVAI